MIWTVLGNAAPWTVVGGLLLWFVRDRRRQRAADEVAERTVEADVEVRELGADDARLVHLTKVWETQRTGLEAALEQRDRLIVWQRQQLEIRDQQIARRDQQIHEMRIRLEDAESRLADATRNLATVRRQLEELESERTRPDAPDSRRS